MRTIVALTSLVGPLIPFPVHDPVIIPLIYFTICNTILPRSCTGTLASHVLSDKELIGGYTDPLPTAFIDSVVAIIKILAVDPYGCEKEVCNAI